jgi:hypothetical protein
LAIETYDLRELDGMALNLSERRAEIAEGVGKEARVMKGDVAMLCRDWDQELIME